MSDRYYRVKKDTFMWSEGAIIKKSFGHGTPTNGHGYLAIEDVWNKVDNQHEYISGHIIEDPKNSDYFERVYPDTLKGNIYRTADKLREIYKGAFIES